MALVFGLAVIGFMFIPRPPLTLPDSVTGVSPVPQLSYAAEYTTTDSNGQVATLNMSIPLPSPALPDGARPTVEAQAYETVINWAKEKNIQLPEDFQKDVLIYAIAD